MPVLSPPHGYVPLPHPAAAAVQRRELVLGSPSTRASTPQSRTQARFGSPSQPHASLTTGLKRGPQPILTSRNIWEPIPFSISFLPVLIARVTDSFLVAHSMHGLVTRSAQASNPASQLADGHRLRSCLCPADLAAEAELGEVQGRRGLAEGVGLCPAARRRREGGAQLGDRMAARPGGRHSKQAAGAHRQRQQGAHGPLQQPQERAHVRCE